LISKFHLLPFGFCLLFLIIAANNLATSTDKDDERFSINVSLSTEQSFFNFFLSLQRTLSLFRIRSHNFLFLGVSSENEAKLSSFSRECLSLGFEEELAQLMCLSSPSQAFTFTELVVKEVSSTAKVLAAVGDTWSAGICREVEGLSVRIGVEVTDALL
jgi:hypothetical protein